MKAMSLKQLTPVLFGTLLIMTGCQQTHAQLQPARIADVSAQSKAQLQKAIQTLLNRDIKIADNAFSQANEILVERATLKDDRGLPIIGREFGNVLKLSLLTDGSSCFLQSSETAELQVTVEGVRCIAL